MAECHSNGGAPRADHRGSEKTAIRSGLEPRTVYFPAGFLARVETRPGALVELLSLALAAYLREGGAQ